MCFFPHPLAWFFISPASNPFFTFISNLSSFFLSLLPSSFFLTYFLPFLNFILSRFLLSYFLSSSHFSFMPVIFIYTFHPSLRCFLLSPSPALPCPALSLHHVLPPCLHCFRRYLLWCIFSFRHCPILESFLLTFFFFSYVRVRVRMCVHVCLTYLSIFHLFLSLFSFSFRFSSDKQNMWNEKSKSFLKKKKIVKSEKIILQGPGRGSVDFPRKLYFSTPNTYWYNFSYFCVFDFVERFFPFQDMHSPSFFPLPSSPSIPYHSQPNPLLPFLPPFPLHSFSSPFLLSLHPSCSHKQDWRCSVEMTSVIFFQLTSWRFQIGVLVLSSYIFFLFIWF